MVVRVMGDEWSERDLLHGMPSFAVEKLLSLLSVIYNDALYLASDQPIRRNH